MEAKPISLRKNGFTLIELLVVIAIISLLVSILLPSLSRAKDLAKRVVCSNTTRSISLNLAIYANDNEGQYPRLGGLGDYTWINRYSYNFVDRSSHAHGYGLLCKNGYMDIEDLYCPGIDKSQWPASNLFDKSSGWIPEVGGRSYPRSCCYNLRGWYYDGDPSDWSKMPENRTAVCADLFLNYTTAFAAHGNGLNVGYSDGSSTFVSGDTDFNGTDTFFEIMQIWTPNSFDGMSWGNYRDVYVFFDTY